MDNMGAEMTADGELWFWKKANVTNIVQHLLHLFHPLSQRNKVQLVVKLFSLQMRFN